MFGRIHLELKKREKFVLPKELSTGKKLKKFALELADKDEMHAEEILMDHCDLKRLEYYLFGTLLERKLEYFALR